VHTPDSSRYWVAATYEDRFRAGLEPDSIDKEFLRRWYVARCDPYSADALPEAPSELVNELARRYDMIVYSVCTRSYMIYCVYDMIVHVHIICSMHSFIR
jgi:phosphoribosylaminoimidazole-succinocarboxamide synthase